MPVPVIALTSTIAAAAASRTPVAAVHAVGVASVVALFGVLFWRLRRAAVGRSRETAAMRRAQRVLMRHELAERALRVAREQLGSTLPAPRRAARRQGATR